MNEELFYKEKIFFKVSINQLIKRYPAYKDSFDLWYRSDRYNIIQGYKSFLNTKIKLLNKDGKQRNLTSIRLYDLYQWWENTPKVCYYCSLPEFKLIELHNIPGHINKRYPQRGQSLEIDRKKSGLSYDNVDNLVLACYWCNNAKTDTFTEDEFLKIGKEIKIIWEQRLINKF